MTGRSFGTSLTLSLGSVLLVFVLASGAQAQTQADCSDFATQEEAQQFYNDHADDTPGDADPFDLDTDGDGQACEGLPTGSGTPTTSAAPTATADPNEELPANGAETGVIALSGLSLLEAGYGLTLASKRLGIRRRQIPLYLMRRMINAAETGSDRVEISDDVYLVHRSALGTNEPADLPEIDDDIRFADDAFELVDEVEAELEVEAEVPVAVPAAPSVYAVLARADALHDR